jgi:hypothetical protein
MARIPGHPSSASLGQTTMIRTIQCPSCGVMLNVPDSAAGRRLKCPHCQNKFSAPAAGPGDSAIAQPSGPESSLFPTRAPSSGSVDLPTSRGRGSSGSVELPTSRGRGSSGDVELPSSPAPLRETFDLPSLSDDAPAKTPAKSAPAADAMALFHDEPKAARKPKGAEARAHARRCPGCGGVVGVGMSLCNTCGLDLDTGQRVVVDLLDDAMPEPYRPPSPSMGVIFVGSLCSVGFLILSAASLVSWAKGQEGAAFLLIVWLFGVYGAVQFLRRKSMRLLFVALSLAVGIGVVALIALPIYDANMPTSAAPVMDSGPVNPVDPDAPQIRPITEQLDMNKISWGIFSLLAYAGLAVYLNSPAMRREFRK